MKRVNSKNRIATLPIATIYFLHQRKNTRLENLASEATKSKFLDYVYNYNAHIYIAYIYQNISDKVLSLIVANVLFILTGK